MDTLKTSFVSTAHSPARHRPAALAWFFALRERLGRSEDENFLAPAADLESLEERLRLLERHGHPLP